MGFINVLGFFTLNDEFYGLTSSLYVLLGNLYKFLVGLAQDSSFISGSIDDFTRTIYVLAGVFMLFRVAVSFLNSLIDPDKFTDKNEGASKILTRLVIVVVLMIGLAPGSFVYGFLDRLQNAVIGENGLIVNITKGANVNVGTAVNKYINDINPFEDSFLSVNAVRNNTGSTSGESDVGSILGRAQCYFYKDGSFDKSYHVNFYRVSASSNGLKTKDGYIYVNGASLLYAKFVTSTDVIDGTSITYVNHNGSIKAVGYSNTNSGSSIVCPKVMKVSNGTMTFYGKASDCPDCDYSGNTFFDRNDNVEGINQKNDQGFILSNSLLSSLSSCGADVSADECSSMKEKLLLDDKAVIDYFDDDKLSISWLIAIIIGIIVFLYLLVLCIEVVVRTLKLTLLQMIAPIAIISYVSPKDKILGQWAKMYASTYLDLFIKLFAISFGASLIIALKPSTDSEIKSLLFILGILVFMKVIPTMISKIFGIDIASGTFKDSIGMLKKGVSAGAGAALAAGAGIIGGAVAGGAVQGGKLKKFVFGAGNALKSGAAGFVGGAASGYGGNVLGGAKKRTTKDQQHRIANASGASFFGTQKSKAMQALGLDDDYITAKNNKAANEIVKSSMSNIEDQALGVANKEAGNGSRIAEFVKLRNATDIFNRVNNNEKVRRYGENEVSQAKFKAQQLSRDLETIKNGGTVYKSNGQVMSLDECKAQLDDNQAIVANEFWDKSTAEVSYFKAQKVAREKVINDVYKFQQTNDKSSFDGYVKLVENGEVNYNDYNKVNEAIGNSQEAAKAAGIKDFMEAVKDTDGKVVGYKYNKDRKDEAEANVTRFDKQMKQSEANHNAALNQK